MVRVQASVGVPSFLVDLPQLAHDGERGRTQVIAFVVRLFFAFDNPVEEDAEMIRAIITFDRRDHSARQGCGDRSVAQPRPDLHVEDLPGSG